MLILLRKNCPQTLKTIMRRLQGYCFFLQGKLEAAIKPSDIIHYCPCCGSKLSRFIVGGFRYYPDYYDIKRYEHTRQDLVCPICRSLPRHRILAIWCEKNIEILKGKRILYFALEDSMMSWLKRKGLPVTTADLFKSADLKIDLECIDQPDNSWDVVFCNHVLEHIKNYNKALSEIKRILVPGGQLICSFPIDIRFKTVCEDKLLAVDTSEKADYERIRRFGQRDHLRVFGLDSKWLLEEAGFLVHVIDGDKMPEEICPVVGPADYDINKLFVCKNCK